MGTQHSMEPVGFSLIEWLHRFCKTIIKYITNLWYSLCNAPDNNLKHPTTTITKNTKIMKKIKLIIPALMLLFLGGFAQAQVSVSLTFGSPPLWGPVGFAEARYYYLPDVEAYYNVQTEMFMYAENGIWIESYYLPVVYRNYDLYSGYKVVLADYHGYRPYDRFTYHKQHYRRGYRVAHQRTIGHRPDHGYQQYDYQYSRRAQHEHRDGHQRNDAVQHNQRQQQPHRDVRSNDQQRRQQPQHNVQHNDQQRKQQPQRNVRSNDQQHQQRPQGNIRSNDQQRKQQPQRNVRSNDQQRKQQPQRNARPGNQRSNSKGNQGNDHKK